VNVDIDVAVAQHNLRPLTDLVLDALVVPLLLPVAQPECHLVRKRVVRMVALHDTEATHIRSAFEQGVRVQSKDVLSNYKIAFSVKILVYITRIVHGCKSKVRVHTVVVQ
jgi:hypothetical protein